MNELIASISSAITITRRLKEVNDNIKNAEFKNLLADLSLDLADMKMKMAEVVEENVKLREKIRELESVEGEPCPKCRKRGWLLESSKPDGVFGELGGMRRTYKCSLCGFSEELLETPR